MTGEPLESVTVSEERFPGQLDREVTVLVEGREAFHGILTPGQTLKWNPETRIVEVHGA